MGDEKINHDLEAAACQLRLVELEHFNDKAELPHGLTVEHVQLAMNSFINFLSFVNQQLHTKGIMRMELMMMSANFSSMVGEFMAASIPEHSKGLVKNRYHNGHPDLIPAGVFPGDAVRYAEEGIEIKASRYLRGWQGSQPRERMVDGLRLRQQSPTRSVRRS